MKKFVALLLTLLLVVTLYACDREEKTTTQKQTTQTTETTEDIDPTLTFEHTEITIFVGGTFELEPITNIKGDDVVTYVISDNTVLSFADGVFTGLKEGTVTITAKLKDYPDVQVTITVTVENEEKPDDETINIVYDLDGGYIVGEAINQIKRDDLPLTLPDAARAGHQFVGWYDNAKFEGDYLTELTEVEGDEITLYARWIVVQEYTIGYILNGGTNASENITKYTIRDLPITLHEPSRPGYIFRGWFTDKNFRHGPIEEITQAKNYSLYALWENTISQKQVLINSALADKDDGDTVEYKGIEYIVGENAFATLNEGFAVAEETVHIVGEFNENVTISTSKLTILGPNANIDPNVEERVEEAVIKGKITLDENVSDITINGLSFTENATITGLQNRNITFIYNYVHDTAQPTKNWQEGSGYDTGFFKFYSANDGNIINITVSYNRFENVPDANLNFARVRNVHVEGNTFKNFKRDAIRFDTGGFNHGELLFIHNTFENDELDGYNGIYFRIYGGDQNSPTTIRIENNRFSNIGSMDLTQYSGAISMRNYQEKSTEIIIEFNEFENCANFIHVRNNAAVHNHNDYPWSGRIRYNIFRGIPNVYYYKNWMGNDNENSNPTTMNFEYNYFEDNDGHPITDLSEYEDKILHVSSYANNYKTYEDYQEMLDNLKASKIKVYNKVERLNVGDELELDILVFPVILKNYQLVISSSDPNVIEVRKNGNLVAVDMGTATITVASKNNPEIKATFEITVPDPTGLEIHFEGPGALDIGEQLQLTPVVQVNDVNFTYEWSSSDETIATVDETGLVTAKSPGEVEITVGIKDESSHFTVTLVVYDGENTSDIIKYFLLNNKGIVSHHSIYYIGSDDGSRDYLNSFYLSVNNYLFETLDIERNMLSESEPNHSGRELASLEFITIHDTANSSPTANARANSNWVLNPSNTATSWHYTVGNDGWFQQLEDNIVGWHAGDGSRKFNLVDTGVIATSENPVVTINERGFFAFDGVESKILAPAVAQITEYGIYVTKGENGNYWMNESYYNTTYRKVVNQGGNYNSIGIETAVNNGSDVHWTWQKTAKLVAHLLDTHDLGLDRVMFHDSFSGKPCPRTMMTAGLEDEFFNLLQAEYEFIKNFSGFTIEFTSHNEDILDNNGRILNAPSETTTVSYTVTVTIGNVTESVTLYAIVQGQ